MSEVTVITDSLSCIPGNMVEKYGIKIAPVIIFYKDRTYRDLIDLSSEQAYKFLDEAPQFWQTSAASPNDYLEMYREINKKNGAVLVVTVSPKLSMFYQSAVAARDMAKKELPDLKIEILDSEVVTAAEGLIALAAADASVQGKSLKDVLDAATKIKEKVKFIALLDTIKFVYRTGRIPKVLSQIGSILPVKPILTTKDGIVKMVNASRSRKLGIEKILSMMSRDIGQKRSVIAVMHAGCIEEAHALKERIAKEYNCKNLFITDFSPVMAYATGKGTLALAYYPE